MMASEAVERSAALGEAVAEAFPADLEIAYKYVDRLCLHLAARAVRESRILDGPVAEVAPEAAYLVGTAQEILEEEGFAARDAGGWRALKRLPDDRSPEIQREAKANCPGASDFFDLIGRCHDHAPAFVSGRAPGILAIFPMGDIRPWGRVHSSDMLMSLYADLVAPAIGALARPGARILELGAGVGAVIRRCSETLRGREVGEYWFTDLGKLFVQRARVEFDHEPFMRFADVDLNRPLVDQGFEPGGLDAIVAVNVLHLATDLGATLRDLRGALRPGGTLIGSEGSPPGPSARWRPDLVFAFLRGWWDVATDAEIRPRTGFLTPSEWGRAFVASGFDAVEALPGESWFRGPCRGGLVLARRPAS